jgi:hypothetical protein
MTSRRYWVLGEIASPMRILLSSAIVHMGRCWNNIWMVRDPSLISVIRITKQFGSRRSNAAHGNILCSGSTSSSNLSHPPVLLEHINNVETFSITVSCGPNRAKTPQRSAKSKRDRLIGGRNTTFISYVASIMLPEAVAMTEFNDQDARSELARLTSC